MKTSKLFVFATCAITGLWVTAGSCVKEGDDNNKPITATLTTMLPDSVTLTTAISGGTVIHNGGDSVIERGICFSNTPDPTIAGMKITSGSGSGIFTCRMFGLLPGAIYYIRAYAINGVGTAYGNQVTTKANSVGLLYKIVDSLNPAAYDTLEYSADRKLLKLYASKGGGSPNNGYTDTFIYNSNNKLIKNHYNLGSKINPALPYAKSDYVYQANVLSSSSYYLGNTNLITTSVYTFDNTGKLIQIWQKQINGGVGSYPTYTVRFQYDVNDNLSKVYYKDDTGPEFLRREYLDYDNKQNPVYNLPWTFDYNVFEENVNRLSKNNVGRIITYNRSSSQQTIFMRYEYNADGKVSKSAIVNGLSSYGVIYYLYRYE
jgi:hypothetical protein